MQSCLYHCETYQVISNYIIKICCATVNAPVLCGGDCANRLCTYCIVPRKYQSNIRNVACMFL